MYPGNEASQQRFACPSAVAKPRAALVLCPHSAGVVGVLISNFFENFLGAVG